MLFSMLCYDKPDSGGLRSETRPTHLEFLQSVGTKIIFAGAMTNDDGDAVLGSKFILSMDDKQEVETFAASDPYAQKGLFERTEIRPLRKAIWNPDSMGD